MELGSHPKIEASNNKTKLRKIDKLVNNALFLHDTGDYDKVLWSILEIVAPWKVKEDEYGNVPKLKPM